MTCLLLIPTVGMLSSLPPSPLLWSSCLNYSCISSCIHTMKPHFWTSSQFLPTAADGDMGSLVLCICPYSLPRHTDEKGCHKFTHTQRCGSLCQTVAPVPGCSWHLTKFLFFSTNSKIFLHIYKFSSFFFFFLLSKLFPVFKLIYFL